MIVGSKVTSSTSQWPVSPFLTCSYVGFSSAPPAQPERTLETPLTLWNCASMHQKHPPAKTALYRLSIEILRSEYNNNINTLRLIHFQACFYVQRFRHLQVIYVFFLIIKPLNKYHYLIMLKIISHTINHHSSSFCFSAPNHLNYVQSPLFPSRRMVFGFSKKHEPHKKKKSEAPKVPSKTVEDYMTGPEHMKKNVLQVKNMQTSSEATLQDDSLRAIIVQQRNLLEKSLHEELNPDKSEENLSLRKRILNKYLKPQELNKYYIKRPLKYLENIYFSLFLINAASLTWLEYTNAYNSIGWFFGYFTAPAATSVLALLIGYNFAFWVVRHSFNLHLPLAKIHQTRISHITTSWRNVAELTFIASQFFALAYCLSFGCPIAMYKFQLLMVTMNLANLALNIYQILKYTRIPFRSYLQDYLKIVSLSTLLILIFALYQIQVTAGSRPEDVFDSEAYRSRVVELNNGHKQYINFFKKKKYVMKENEKINAVDVD